ncbi:MAG: FMN-binding protein [Treponema sp.]|nr:FMN-binding protein [Treponema sp.]
MKNDYIIPILALSLICLFVSGTLALVNNFTAPVIQIASAARAAEARRQIIPSADDFELIVVEGLPRTITEVYKAAGNAGYIFMITIPGYGGDINMICGIDVFGKIIRTRVLSHTETKGMTDPVFSEPHESQYHGKDRYLLDIAAVTGATISSNAYRNGVRDAFTAFELVHGHR